MCVSLEYKSWRPGSELVCSRHSNNLWQWLGELILITIVSRIRSKYRQRWIKHLIIDMISEDAEYCRTNDHGSSLGWLLLEYKSWRPGSELVCSRHSNNLWQWLGELILITIVSRIRSKYRQRWIKHLIIDMISEDAEYCRTNDHGSSLGWLLRLVFLGEANNFYSHENIPQVPINNQRNLRKY